ncbi:putative aldehyde dehydrogenase [Longispora fulva]|uniref:Acyl-CoA reductase-like NAD-dependent aldehyde dehydrogenase n=1 Tax=Longispora fulva TaxID=619741 RepID=A0A8J7GKR8_9ACTN|nr:aldehyde dehydrogenase family protein [Longispora fulva]MBG6134759.1 acyl-CoA reductase-like NAD-dependent aldehyde dehydrogenase [Longispora fulva]GIG61970.1 putative aldehyde dehydrogenase [Longispora fulva]
MTDTFDTLALKARLEEGADAAPGETRIAGRVALSTAGQGAEALRLARAAQPAWARVPLADRLAFLAAFHHDLRKNEDEFIGVLVAEGHPVQLARWELSGVLAATHPTMIARISAQLDWSGEYGDRRIRLRRRPDGVVCLSPPRNAAASNAMYGVVALAAGNALVVNAPPTSPLGVAYAYQEIVAPLLTEFGGPPGTLAVLCGHARPTLRSWLDSPDVDDICLFGPSDHGLRFEQQCVAAGKKPILELSGNDGVLVWKDADLALAATALAECFTGSGQICMLPRYALAHPDVAEPLIAAVADRARDLRPGLPEDPDTVLTPVIRRAEFTRVIAEATDAGAVLVTGGRLLDVHGAPAAQGPFAEPAVLRVDGLATAARLAAVRDETFFPLLTVVVPEPGDDLLDRMLAFLDTSGYGLRNSLWAEDPDVVERFCAEVRGGLLKVNDSHIGFVPGLPVQGGPGRSGGAHGEANNALLRTTHAQGVSIGTGVVPRSAIFDHATVNDA